MDTTKKKHKHGHGENKEGHDEDNHKHGHDEKKSKHGHDEKHKHGHDEKKHQHDHDEKKHKYAQSDDPYAYDLINHYDHNDHDEDDHHGHSGPKEDMNIKAVFVHYLGDAVSSLFVLAAGLIMHYFPDQPWVKYVDPASSLLIVILVLASVIPLIQNCSNILLQQVPSDIDSNALQVELEGVPGIRGVHDLHIWQLVDSMIIASLHVSISEADVSNFELIVSRCKKILHRFGIHSSTLQPEFVARDQMGIPVCSSNCIQSCKEDWCCKSEFLMNSVVDYDTFSAGESGGLVPVVQF